MGWRFRKSIRLAKGVRLNLESGKKRGQPNRINGDARSSIRSPSGWKCGHLLLPPQQNCVKALWRNR